MFSADRRVTLLQHVPQAPAGRIGLWALENGLGLERVRLWAGDPVPSADEMDALVLLGGSMRVDDGDAHPWLADERALIQAAAEAGVPVLGVGLGAQLIAAALGGSVEAMEAPEIGLFPVETTDAAGQHPLTKAWPKRFTPLHWHADRVELPSKARLLASSEACREQAFAIDEHVLGLAFHLELDPQDVDAIAEADPPPDEPGPWTQPVDEIRQGLEASTELAGILDATLDAWGPPD